MTPELVLPAALIAGFFGAAHCLGMCGAVVVLLEGQGAGGLARRLCYNAGRGLFYVLLGIVAASAGALLTRGMAPGLFFLRVLSALLIIAMGLTLACDWRLLQFLERAGAGLWRRLSPLARHVLPVTTAPRALAAGFLWGALPCGLVYGAVALAATSGSGLRGGAVMIAFWLGTLPALLLAGASASLLARWRQNPRLRRVAGALLIVIGALALAMPWLHRPAANHAPHAAAGDAHGAGAQAPSATAQIPMRAARTFCVRGGVYGIFPTWKEAAPPAAGFHDSDNARPHHRRP